MGWNNAAPKASIQWPCCFRHSGDKPYCQVHPYCAGFSIWNQHAYLPGGHCKISFTCYALRKWWLLQLCLVGTHCVKGQRELLLENIHKCSLFPLGSGPQSLSKAATHHRKGCWTPEEIRSLHGTIIHKKAKRDLKLGREREEVPVTLSTA